VFTNAIVKAGKIGPMAFTLGSFSDRKTLRTITGWEAAEKRLSQSSSKAYLNDYNKEGII
jgi:hypothetical protein